MAAIHKDYKRIYYYLNQVIVKGIDLFNKKKKPLISRLKRLAPKVPDYTCPDIDFIVDKIENNDKGFTKFRKKLLVRKLERLRIQNEQLRDSGEYWYKKLKNYLIDFLD